jgi:hypothetical protein
MYARASLIFAHGFVFQRYIVVAMLYAKEEQRENLFKSRSKNV